jgi:hypothetical protein
MSDAQLLGTHRICTAASDYPRGMKRRRGQMDPFLTSRQTQWLLVTVVGGSVVSTTVLNPAPTRGEPSSTSWTAIVPKVGFSRTSPRIRVCSCTGTTNGEC